MKPIILAVAFLALAVPTFAQSTCFTIDNVFMCTGPHGSTTQIQTYNTPSYSSGYLQSDQGTDYYQIYKTPPARFDPAPLPSLPTLPSLPSVPAYTPSVQPLLVPSVETPVFMYERY